MFGIARGVQWLAMELYFAGIVLGTMVGMLHGIARYYGWYDPGSGGWNIPIRGYNGYYAGFMMDICWCNP